MGERRRRRRADPEAVRDVRPGGVVESAPPATRTSVDPRPADVVRRSAVLGGNAAALRTASALGFAGGDLAADAYTGEEPPDFFFGALADLDLPVPVPQDVPPSARAPFSLTVTGPAAPGVPDARTGDDGGQQSPAGAEPAAVGEAAPETTEAGPDTDGPRAPAGSAAPVATVSDGAPGRVGTSAPAAPANAVGPAAVQSPDELKAAVTTAAGKLGAASVSFGLPPDVAAGRAFPSSFVMSAAARPGPARVRGGGVRKPSPDDDLPPDPVPKATQALKAAADRKLPELILPDLLSPPGGPTPTLVLPQQLAELKRPTPPEPEKPKKKKPAAKAKPEPVQEPPAPTPAPQPFVPPVLLDLRRPPMAKLDPTLRSAEQSKIRSVIATVKADLPTSAKPFVRKLRDSAGFDGLLTAQYARKDVAGFWEKAIGDEPLLARLTAPMEVKLDELAEAAGVAGSILQQAVQERQQELVASGRAVSDRTKAQVQKAGPVVVGEAEKRAAEETAKVAKEHAQRLKALRRAMTSHDPLLVTQLADERVTIIGDQVAAGILALENAATRRIEVLEALTSTYLEAYAAADSAAQRSAREAAAKAADPAPPPSRVPVPLGPDGGPWLSWARRQVVDSMKLRRTQTTTDRDLRIAALRESGVAATAAVREWANRQVRAKATQQEKEAQAVADKARAEERIKKARSEAVKNEARDGLVAQIRYAEAFHEARQAETAGTATQAQKTMLAQAGKDADAYLGAADVPGDPLSAVAHHLAKQVATQVVASLTESGAISTEVKGLRAATFQEALSLGVVVFASKPPDAASRVGSIAAATRDQIGTEEDPVFAALDNLDEQQIHTVRTLYRTKYDEDLYDRLDGELSGSEWDRAKALLAHDQVGATAAAIRYETNSVFSAPDRDKIASYVRSLPPGKADELTKAFGASARWYNSGSATLDEVLGDTMRTYRFDPQTGTHVADDRGSEQIGLMLQVNMAKRPEPTAPPGLAGAPKPTVSVIDAQDRQNKVDALQAKVDAIDLDLALRPSFGPAKADAMDAVFKRMRAEIAEANPAWTAEQVSDEVRRRNANVERAYGDRFPAELRVNSYGMPVQNLRPEDSRLRQVMAANLYASGEKEIGLAMLDVDRKAERTARILLADRGAYAADSDVSSGLEQAHLQAADEIKRTDGQRLRKESADRVKKAQDEGRPLTQDELAEEDRKVDRELERLTDARASQLMAETKVHFADSGHGSLDEWVKDKTQGGGEREAVWRLEQGGKLTRAQELVSAVNGWGIDMPQTKKAFAGRTPQEIETIKADYKKITGEDLVGRLRSETSGENRFDIDEALRGEPMTAQERMDALTRRYEYNKSTYFWGAGPPEHLQGNMRILQAEYDYAREAFDALKDPSAKLSVEDRNVLQRSFEAQVTRTEARAEEYRASVHAYTDEIVQIVSTAVAVVVGGALAVATGGAALPLIALAASLWATAATMVVKMALLGEAYGIHEYIDDAVVGAVDAAFAYATAGLGDKLLGLGKVTGADKAAIKLSAAAIRAQRAAKPLVARLGTSLVENVSGAAPSALASNLVNRDNWRGDMFLNVTKGTFTQMGTGLVVGGVLGQSLEMGGRVLGAVAGPALEKFRAGRSGNAATEAAALAAGIGDHQHVPSAERAPRPTTDATGARVARIETEPDAVRQQQRSMRREVLGDIPPRERAVFADTPITVLSDADYFARTGSAERGMATVLIVDGKPEVVIREGAPLWALREEGRHLQQLRDPIYAEHLRLLDEVRLRDWKNLSLHERMLSAQAHLELELAAQHDIIADLAHQKLVGSGDAHLGVRLETAIRAEDALGARLRELTTFRNSPEGSPVPVTLEEPPRLHTKKGGPPSPGEIKVAEEKAVGHTPGPPGQATLAETVVAGGVAPAGGASSAPTPAPKRKRAPKKAVGTAAEDVSTKAPETPEGGPLTSDGSPAGPTVESPTKAADDAKAAQAKAAADARTAAEAEAEAKLSRDRAELARAKESVKSFDEDISHLTRAQEELRDVVQKLLVETDPTAKAALVRRRLSILADINTTFFDPDVPMPLTALDGSITRELDSVTTLRRAKVSRVIVLEHRVSGDPLDPLLPTAGRHDTMPAQKGDRHHIPASDALTIARTINPGLPANNELLTHPGGACMRMDQSDHHNTASHGTSNTPKGGSTLTPENFRQKQGELIAAGKYLEAVEMDIDELRANASISAKYEKHIQRYLDFLERNVYDVQQLNKNSELTIDKLRKPK